MFHRSVALLLVGSLLPVLGLGAPSAPAPAAPAEPASYHVRIHYRLDAFRTERIRQYKQMPDFLGKGGSVRDADEDVADDEAENPRATRMRGVIPARGLRRILQQRHVRSLLAYPTDTKLP